LRLLIFKLPEERKENEEKGRKGEGNILAAKS